MEMIYSTEPLPRSSYVQIAKNYYAVRTEWTNMSKKEQHLDMCACVALRRKQLLFTGQSACSIYNIPRLDSFEMRPNCISEKVKGSDIIRWHHGNLDPNARVIGDFHVASPLRTIFDLAKYDSPESLLVSINHCLFNKLFDTNEFAAELMKRPGILKIRLLRRLLRFANEKCESPLETIAWIELYKAGFVLPQQQVDIFDNHKFVGCVDMCWEFRGRKVVLELDGNIKYAVGDDLLAEKRRENNIRKVGCEVYRAEWREVKGGEFIQMMNEIGMPKRRHFTGTFPQ